MEPKKSKKRKDVLGVKIDDLDFKLLLKNFYFRYNEENLVNIPLIYEKFKGSEVTMITKLCLKYEVRDPELHHILLTSLIQFELENVVWEDALSMFYSTFDDKEDKLENIDQVLARFPTDKDKLRLVDGLCNKYAVSRSKMRKILEKSKTYGNTKSAPDASCWVCSFTNMFLGSGI